MGGASSQFSNFAIAPNGDGKYLLLNHGHYKAMQLMKRFLKRNAEVDIVKLRDEVFLVLQRDLNKALNSNHSPRTESPVTSDPLDKNHSPATTHHFDWRDSWSDGLWVG